MKNTFKNLFLILVIFLMVLPFITTFNEFLTKIVEKTYLYKLIQATLIPYETMLVRTIISFFGIQTPAGTVAIVKNGVPQGTYIAWNCIGWQSLVILLLSLKVGFQGNFTKLSVLQAAIFGILGTFLINIFRISTIIILLYYFDKLPAMLFHNYSSVILTIFWLFFFWWFAYSFVLEEKNLDEVNSKEEIIAK